LEKAAEVHYVEHAAQKARRETKAKAKKETERQRFVKKEKKRKMLEYIQ